MEVRKIKNLIAQYKKILLQRKAPKDLYLWEAQQVFQDHWDIDTSDFAAMYEQAINSKQTLRYWKTGQYQPKQMMAYFIEMDVAWVKSMFEDLFNESVEIEARVERFLFLMDETLKMYRSKNPLSIDTNHYHGDYRMISLYLSFRYPTQYAYYQHEDFVRFLQNVHSPKIPLVPDFIRFCKVSNIIYTFMKKEEGLLEIFHSKLLNNTHYTEESRMIVFDFLRCV